MEGSIFYRLLRPVLGALLASVLFLASSMFYFQRRIETADEARRLALKIQISALQMRREQDEFLLQDVTRPGFYESGMTGNIRDQRSQYESTKQSIKALSALSSGRIIPQLDRLQLILDAAEKTFSKVVAAYRNRGFKDTVNVTKEINSFLAIFYDEVRGIEPIIGAIISEQDKREKAEQALLHAASLVIFSLSLGLGLFLVKSLTHRIADPLIHLKKKVLRFKAKGGFHQTKTAIEEINLLDQAFFEMFQSLDQSQKQLLQAQKMESIGTLAGGIAHDFNNLLASIMAYVGILRKKSVAMPDLLKDLDTIEKSAERGAELTRQLLGFARKGNYQKTKFDLNKTVMECVNLLSRTVEKTIAIKTDLGKDLHLIDGDPGQILQALMNLGVNARDAMPGSGELLIESQNFEADEHFCNIHGKLKPGHYVRISVSDTGTGMPKHVQEKIFDPFFTTKEVGKGTGLGLAMVYGIMQSHHGFVSVYSEVGHGTQFHLYFPAVQTIGDTIATAIEPKAQTGQNTQRLQGQMILIVDDEPLMRNAAKDILESEGATVFLAINGEEAMSFLETSHSLVNLVLSDVVMPKMDGAKMLRELRKLNPALPVVLSSGYAENRLISEARQEFKINFIQKPYKSHELVDLISAQLGEAGQSNQKAA